jgi:hypothetical protein
LYRVLANKLVEKRGFWEEGIPSEDIGLRNTAGNAHAQKAQDGFTSAMSMHAIAENTDEQATR